MGQCVHAADNHSFYWSVKYSGGDPSSSGMIRTGEGEGFISEGDGTGLESGDVGFGAGCGMGVENVCFTMANKVKYILPFAIKIIIP